MKVNSSPWHILGVEPGATIEEITLAFRRLALTHHPDKGGCDHSFAKIHNAYKELKTKKHVPVIEEVSTILVDVKLTIEQQIKGVNDVIVAYKPNSKDQIALAVKIPPGAMVGDKFKVKEKTANYIINIKEKLDPVFTRDGYNVIMDYELDIITAMKGGEIQISGPCGIQHTLTINSGTNNTILVIPNEGLYNKKTKKRGNIYVNVTATIPKLYDDNIEAFINKLRQ
jgi:DnaJ-class molecular chaperone